jgi:hypothetical protein
MDPRLGDDDDLFGISLSQVLKGCRTVFIQSPGPWFEAVRRWISGRPVSKKTICWIDVLAQIRNELFRYMSRWGRVFPVPDTALRLYF